ncbi:hypothetical protein QOZ80_1BG0089320 [Eleusine coracana subsp. coracana]|nr:hypothetical protein QOZ80_1BG0089320 [Eleusine coracana subsp. coracana]
MAVVVAGGRARAEPAAARLQWREHEPRSPEMAAPPRPPRPRPARASVVYYLSRNGHLEHPHFMEVALSCPDGLYLRDVIDRLDALRGKGMARMYSWASKRSYRNGFVWHDLADDDYIHPVVGREYVLKGTERLQPVPLPLLDTTAAAASSSSSETPTSSSSGSRWEQVKPAHRKKSASAAVHQPQYVVYKQGGEDRAADAATQTEDAGRGHHQKRLVRSAAPPQQDELSRADTSSSSPPTASTSPETLEALIKADHHRIVVPAAVASGAGRARAASSVLMQLISCGSVAVRDAHAASPVMPQRTARPPRPPPASGVVAAADRPPACRRKVVVVEDKEYFSGSIVEMATKRSPADDDACGQDLAVLRRSSSYNADRVIKLELAKEVGDLHDRCMPRRPKSSKKDGGYLVIACNGGQGNNNKG